MRLPGAALTNPLDVIRNEMFKTDEARDSSRFLEIPRDCARFLEIFLDRVLDLVLEARDSAGMSLCDAVEMFPCCRGDAAGMSPGCRRDTVEI